MKTLLKIVLIFITLLVLAVAIFFLTFDLNMYKGMITEAASKAIGRDVKIDSLEMKLSLIPTIKIHGVQIANPDGFASDKPFLMTDSIEATLAVMPLFSHRIEVRDFALGTVGLTLIDTGKGQNNWTFGTPASATTSASVATDAPAKANVVRSKSNPADDWLKQMRIDNVFAKNISVVYVQGDHRQSVSVSDFSLKQLKAFSLTTAYDGISMKISGSLNNILDLLEQKPDYAFNLEVQAVGATAKLSANIGNIKDFSDILLNVDVSGNNLRQTLTQLKLDNKTIPAQAFSGKAILQGGLSGFQLTDASLSLGIDKATATMIGDITLTPPAVNLQGNLALTDKNLAASFGLKPVTAQFDLAATPQVMTIKQATVQANRSPIQVTGTIALDTPKPTFDLMVKSDILDIQDFWAESASKTVSSQTTAVQSESATGLIPDQKIDLSALNALNARVTFDFPYIRVTNSLAGNLGLSGKLNLTDGLLRIDPLAIRLLDAQTTGSLSVNAAQQPYHIALKLKGESLDLEKLAPIAAQVRDATLDFDVDLTSVGSSTKALIAALKGNVVVEMPQGLIVNKWFNTLPAAMGVVRRKKNSVTFSTTDQESHILCGAVNFRIQNGLIESDNNIAIETSTINFLVGGRIDLNTETMALTMTPSLNGEQDNVNDVLSATQYIKINGTFLEPTASLDTKRVVDNAVRAGLTQLAKKAGLNNTSSTDEVGAYQLCAKVLDRQPKGQIIAERKAQEKKQVIPAATPVQQPTQQPTLSPKEQFKNQLLKSITDALQ